MKALGPLLATLTLVLVGAVDVFGATPPSVSRNATGEVVLQTTTAPNAFTRIEASPDVQAWTPLATLLSPGALAHTDTASPYLAQRFYRLQELAGTGYLTGDHLPTSAGEVVIHPGESCFLRHELERQDDLQRPGRGDNALRGLSQGGPHPRQPQPQRSLQQHDARGGPCHGRPHHRAAGRFQRHDDGAQSRDNDPRQWREHHRARPDHRRDSRLQSELPLDRPGQRLRPHDRRQAPLHEWRHWRHPGDARAGEHRRGVRLHECALHDDDPAGEQCGARLSAEGRLSLPLSKSGQLAGGPRGV